MSGGLVLGGKPVTETKVADASESAQAPATGGALPNTTEDLPDATESRKDGIFETHAVGDPSAESVGLDTEPSDLEKEVAAQNASRHGLTGDSDGTIYTSHPTQNMQLGRFVFENGTMTLRGDDVAEFEAILKQLPASERSTIARLDLGRVDDIVQSRDAIAGISDSSAGRAALERLKQTTPRLGTVALEDMGKPGLGFSSATGNAPVIVDTKPPQDESDANA